MCFGAEVCTQLMQALGGQRVALISLDEFYRDLTPEEHGTEHGSNEGLMWFKQVNQPIIYIYIYVIYVHIYIYLCIYG